MRIKGLLLALITFVISLSFAVSGQDDDKVTMYTPDGRTIRIAQSAVDEYKAVGWYEQPVVYMYAMDGRKILIKKSAVEAYKKVGWYETEEEIYQWVYSLSDKRYVMRIKADDWVKVGWSKESYPIVISAKFSRTSSTNSCIDLYVDIRNTSKNYKAVSKLSFDAYYLDKNGNGLKDIYGNKCQSVTYDCNNLSWYSDGEAFTKYFANVTDCYRLRICNIKITYADGTTEAVNGSVYAYCSQ
ncbi:MAG: hypothetical protein J6K12_04320 [Clostridia bacterium]|nr:hypothetical protein [Clostridia bacterium]